MTIKWTSRARRELTAQLDFIALDKPSAADRMAGLVAESTTMLASFPESGKPGHIRGSRELSIAGTPFMAIYKLTGQNISILRLLHGAQKWPQ